MSQSKEEISDKNITGEQCDEYSIINNMDIPKLERIALVKSMTDRLQLTLDDIRNSVNSEKLNSLSIVPPDLLPFEVTLADGQKVTIMENNPVVTCFDGEITNLEGNIIHIYLRNEGEELPEDFIPPKKMFTVTSQTLETVLPSIIKDLIIPSTQESKFLTNPSTSKKLDPSSDATYKDISSCSNRNKEAVENSKNESMTTASKLHNISTKLTNSNQTNKNLCTKNSNDIAPSSKEVEVFTHPEVGNIAFKENNETSRKKLISPEKNFLKQNDPFIEKDTSFSSKFQVIGLVDTGIFRDSGSEEGLHNAIEDLDNKDTATIIIDKELGNPSDFRSVFLKTPSPVPPKKSVVVRKSSRPHKPKIRSPYKSWDDLKIRLPRHKRKGRASKGTQLTNQKTKEKKIVKKLNHKIKNANNRK